MKNNSLPTLEELLKRRGVEKTSKFNDYQEYINKMEEKVRPSLFPGNRILSEGSMHLALGRIMSVRNFRH